MTLLFLTLPGDNGHDLVWPWEQDADLHRALTAHAASASCSRCVLVTGAVFGTDTMKSTFTPACATGTELAQAIRAHAVTKRASR
jgi:hypothetical protein